MTPEASGSRPVIAVAMAKRLIGPVLSPAAEARLRTFAEVRRPGDGSLADETPELLRNAAGCITSWGSPRFEQQLLDRAPKLEIVAYAAGSVRGIVAPALYARGIIVTSSAAAIAEEVAVCALGLIICSLKGIFRASRVTRSGGWGGDFRGNDTCGRTVGILGAGHVGRRVLGLLRMLPGGGRVLLYDPCVSADESAALGAEKTDLDELLRSSDVVSLHVPSIPSTKHLINRENLPLLRDDASLINTARGSLIDPAALADELTRRPSLQAIIDVTDPDEPPPADHPYRKLPNVILTPHLAGTVAGGQSRIGDLAVEELYRHFVLHEPPLNPVTEEMLDRVA